MVNPLVLCAVRRGVPRKTGEAVRHMDTVAELRELVEAHVAQLRADVDVASDEVDAFLQWLAAFAETQRAEIRLEEWTT